MKVSLTWGGMEKKGTEDIKYVIFTDEIIQLKGKI
jgi:hypothetical protein